MSQAPHFTFSDHATWNKLFIRQAPLRNQQIIPEFSRGLEMLGIDETKIPDINLINERLKPIAGWQAVYTSGFVEAPEFFKMLSERKFPIGNFIRDAKDLSYTPAPDVFHDLYGHIPFYTIPAYADFCQKFGELALRYIHMPEAINEFQRLFWFTVEFALVKTKQGVRVFGAGIASSFSECAYALSAKPQVTNFDLETIRNKNFRIDLIQEDLFLLESAEQLYNCLGDFEEKFQKENACKTIKA